MADRKAPPKMTDEQKKNLEQARKDKSDREAQIVAQAKAKQLESGVVATAIKEVDAVFAEFDSTATALVAAADKAKVGGNKFVSIFDFIRQKAFGVRIQKARTVNGKRIEGDELAKLDSDLAGIVTQIKTVQTKAKNLRARYATVSKQMIGVARTLQDMSSEDAGKATA